MLITCAEEVRVEADLSVGWRRVRPLSRVVAAVGHARRRVVRRASGDRVLATASSLPVVAGTHVLDCR